MTVQSTVNKITHLVSDIGQTEYIYDFRVDESDQMIVFLNDIQQSPGDYIVNDLGSLTGGTITISFTTALDDQLLILREMPLTQLLDYITYGKFPSASHEKGLDYGVMIDQQLQEAYSRAMRFPVYEDVDPLLPSPEDDYALVWENNALVNKLYANSGGEVLIHNEHDLNGRHIDFSSVDSLRAATLAAFDGQMIGLTGYYESGDGGGQKKGLYYDASSIESDNSVTIFKRAVDTTGRFKSIDPEFITIRQAGAKLDGSTDDLPFILNAIAAAPVGGSVYINPTLTYCKITDEIPIAKALTIYGEGENSEIRQVTGSKHGFVVTSSDVEIKQLHLKGVQFAVNLPESAVLVNGADSSNYLTNIKIHDNIISNWGDDGITGEFFEDFRIHNNTIKDCYYSGMLLSSVRSGTILNNKVENIIGDPLAYGITLTRGSVVSLVTNPRSANVIVANNAIDSVSKWNGLDAHGCDGVLFIGNTVDDCYQPIQIGPASNGTAQVYAPLKVKAIGNIIDSLSTDGTKNWGINVVGGFDGAVIQEYAEDCSVIGNTFKDQGLKDGSADRVAYFTGTKNLLVDGNTFTNPTCQGLQFFSDNLNFSCINNKLIDVWNETSGVADGVTVKDENNTGFIAGNTFSQGDKSATYKNRWAINIADAPGNIIQIGKNILSNWTDIDGGYILDPGQKALRGSATGNEVITGTGEQDMKTQIIPAGVLGDGMKVKVHIRGVNQGSTDTKTIKLYFGAASITIIPTHNNSDAWSADVLVWIDDQNSQRVSAMGYRGIAIVYNAHSDLSIAITSAVEIKTTAELSGATDAIVQYTMSVEIE